MDQKTSALTEAQVSAYLERIGLAAGVQGEQPSKDGLVRIIEAHQNRVPFETIDLVQTGTRPDLSVDGLYKKVVEDRHGGYCFELNRLFRELLLALGYKTRPAFARPVLGGDPRAMNHRGELVELDGVLNYVDVGFGGPSSTMPVALADSQETFDGRTRFVAYDECATTVPPRPSSWSAPRPSRTKTSTCSTRRCRFRACSSARRRSPTSAPLRAISPIAQAS